MTSEFSVVAFMFGWCDTFLRFAEPGAGVATFAERELEGQVEQVLPHSTATRVESADKVANSQTGSDSTKVGLEIRYKPGRANANADASAKWERRGDSSSCSNIMCSTKATLSSQ